MPLNSVYLSGWEYNRILASDPATPLPSMLPSQPLWTGGAQFWLFQNVYCTKEAFDAEIRASDRLGFAAGTIYQDLLNRGFLTLVDWRAFKDTHSTDYAAMQQIHADLHHRYTVETMRTMIREGQATRLDALKLRLLSPMLRALNCVHNISSTNVGQWFASNEPPAPITAGHAIETVASPIVSAGERVHLGTILCRHPRASLPPDEWRRQRQEELHVQAPLIPDLFTNLISPEDYWAILARNGNVYQPGNRAMLEDWQRNVIKLERLRDAAAATLWRPLHYDWLPHLQYDATFYEDFKTLFRDALLRATFAPYLDYAVFIIIATLAAINPMVSAAPAAILAQATRARNAETEPVLAFYQRAFNIVASE